MNYNFDKVINRTDHSSAKWLYYGPDKLPLWVADMDFVSPEPVTRALHERVAHGVFGYTLPPPELSEIICQRLEDLYDWQVTPQEILYVPGLVPGFNIACRAIGEPGDEVLVQTPVYPPFLSAPANQKRKLITAELAMNQNGSVIRFEIDYDVFESAITPKTRLFILCNPHNPVGRSYTWEELTRLAEICRQHDMIICSDEIHCDLLLGDTKHIPIATLSPEVAQQCITLLAPSKTYNLPGLGCGFAIVQNPKLRKQMKQAMAGITGHVNVMGYTAAIAAYTEGNEWLAQVLNYLKDNRDFAVDFVRDKLPGVTTTVPEATYLTWLDCRQTDIENNPHRFFLDQAGVALNDGIDFGPCGQGFVRLNFACPRSVLAQALEQMRQALKSTN